MPPFTIHKCTIRNSEALARNNMSAFWTDSNWVLVWGDRTLEDVIKQAALRTPFNLLTNRSHKRHQVAIDERTGEIVGYIRWILPDGMGLGMSDKEMGNIWSEAIVPEVSDQEKKEAEKLFQSADWIHRPPPGQLDVGDIDIPVRAMENKLKKKKYLTLDYLAVHPDHRRQGIATILVESGIREAEKMGLPIFVLAMKAGYGVYKKLGFKLLDQIIQDDSMYGGKGEYGVYFLEKEVEKMSDLV
ncbi:hypothetical protein B7463_g846, partial [Scytalidium lignicola]